MPQFTKDLASRAALINPQHHWRKLRPILEESRPVWFPWMLEYRAGKQLDCYDALGYLGWDMNMALVQYPCELDSCDWRRRGHGGSRPAYWKWVCHAACYFLSNLQLHAAMSLLPNEEWCIVHTRGRYGGGHACVWNQDAVRPLIFDMQGSALFDGIEHIVDMVVGKGNPTQHKTHTPRPEPTGHNQAIVQRRLKEGVPLNGRPTPIPSAEEVEAMLAELSTGN